ncbi:unnamed protein product [Cylindrotheca closterium]|uniref:Uncharacterized protein n=1 Tax=Cylindrotheca closterium TaxID=2856 RepID=A0AAD2JJQ4_9STRA|nr:unnamed protein product [Cylindrotheca closterium]
MTEKVSDRISKLEGKNLPEPSPPEVIDEEVMEEEVVEISDDSDEENSASVEISASTPQSDEPVEEEVVEEQEIEEYDEEVVFQPVFEPVEYDEILVSSSHHISMGSSTLDTDDVASFADEEIEFKPPSNDAETGAETRIDNLGQIDDEEKVEEVMAAPDDEVEEHDDSWDPGRRHHKVLISPGNHVDDQYDNDDESLGSHSWMPHRKQPSHESSDGVTPRTSHRKSEGIRLEDAINSIDGAPFSPSTSKISFDTTIKSSDTLDNWNISPQIEGNPNDRKHKVDKDSSESDDSSMIRRQKQVQFAGLPEHPPELRKTPNAHLAAVQEKIETGSSSSYETDSEAASSVYETDSSSEDAIIRPTSTESGRRLAVNYRPSTSVRSAPSVNPVSSLPKPPLSLGSSGTSDVESQPQNENFVPAAETSPKESKFFKAQILCLAILLLIGTALCLYFFYDFTRDEHRNTFNLTPTIAPVVPPTRPTAQPILPTISPTKSPSEPTPNTPTPITPTPDAPSPNNPTPDTTAPTAPTPSTSSPTRFQSQNNDECADAIGPVLPGTNIQGTTVNAREDDVSSCDNTSNNGLPGVWYYVLGNGGEMMAHTCSNTSIDSKISIYGGPCSNAQCLEVSDNFCGRQSAVSWDSEFQKPYYVLVQGRTIQRSIGDFELSIEARYNDECKDVITLEASPDANAPNAPIIKGQTLEANPNSFVCNGVTNESPSLFYAVRGTGEELAVIFQEGTDFNPRISVLVGDCSRLSCVAQSDEGDIQFSWASIRDMKYYILVHGETARDVGNFAFQVLSADAIAQGRLPW